MQLALQDPFLKYSRRALCTVFLRLPIFKQLAKGRCLSAGENPVSSHHSFLFIVFHSGCFDFERALGVSGARLRVRCVG